jgi:hypothetical protein
LSPLYLLASFSSFLAVRQTKQRVARTNKHIPPSALPRSARFRCTSSCARQGSPSRAASRPQCCPRPSQHSMAASVTPCTAMAR